MDIRSHHLPIEVYSPRNQHHPSHHHSKCDPKEVCCRRNGSTNTTSVYQDSTVCLHKKCYERNKHITRPPTNDPSQVKWSRSNIAMTMEYFEPISSTSTPKRHSNQPDYSYAYYEPGAVMRHSNIPKMLTTDTRSSPKSIRSLLCKPNDETANPNNRHTYTTRYGTQENIYEDVSSIRIDPGFESSSQSLNAQGGSKIEFQDILHNHYRVLEELNLSVEEMLLSTTTKTSALLSPRKLIKRSTKLRTKVRSSDVMNSKNIFASSMNKIVVGEDSGFSGSSSGASYVGSLRNFKTALSRSHRNSTEISHLNNVTDCGTLQGAINVNNSKNSRQLQTINQLKADKDIGSSKGLKFPFWNKRQG